MKRETYVLDLNGEKLLEGDRVLYEVIRNSSSHSTWGQIKNRNHGIFRIHGVIKFDGGTFVIEGDQKEIKNLKKPKGMEQYKQNVWFEKIDLGKAKGVEKVSNDDPSRPLSRYEILNNF